MKRSAILTRIRDLNFYTDQEEEKIRYAWLSIRNDLFKIIILWLVAVVLGFNAQFIIVLTAYCSLRMWIGGIHKQTFIGCLVDTGIWIGIGIGCSVFFLRISCWTMICIGIAAMIPILLSGPIQSPKKRPIEQPTKKKRTAIAALIAVFIILVQLAKSIPVEIRSCLLSGLLIESLQVLLINFLGKGRNHGGIVNRIRGFDD